MEDIVPELYKKIKSKFGGLISSDEEIQAILNGDIDGTFAELYQMSKRIGKYAATSLVDSYADGSLPDETLYWNILERTIEPIMKDVHNLDNELAFSVQKKIDEKDNIGIKPQKTDYPKERVDNVMNKIATISTDGKTDLKKTSQILNRSLVNISNSVVDDFIKVNAEFRYNSGMSAKIIRTSSGHCCEWCDKIAGIYKYPDVPKDVYRRHDNCECLVEYVSGKDRNTVHSGKEGKRRYVQDEYGNYKLTKEARIEHAKQMEETEAERKRIAREKRIDTWQRKKEIALSKGQDVTAEYEHTKFPGQGKIEFEEGYDKKKNQKEIEFANWIHNNLGGDITLNLEKNKDKVKTPDYTWRNNQWELKCPTTEKAIDSALRKAVSQLDGNTGGIILNFENNDVEIDEVIKNVEKRMERSGMKENPIDVMIVLNEKMEIVIQYKK